MRVRPLMPSVACLMVGLLIGLGWEDKPSNTQPGPPEVSSRTPRGAPSCPAPGPFGPLPAQGNAPSLADIRAAIREELRAELAAYRSPNDEVEERVPGEDAEQRRQLAHERASRTLADAVRHGAWSQEAREQFRSTLHELSIPQQDQLIGELFSAIQSGRLKLDGAGPPL